MKNLSLSSLLVRLRPPRPRRLLRPSGLDAALGAARRAPIVVLSRELCRFASFEVPLASSRRQVAAIRLQIEQLSPFALTGLYAVVSGAQVSAWYWDEARVAARLTEAGVDSESAELWPESVLAAPGDGARLFKTCDGYEGRIEAEGVVVGSRWWHAEPSAEEWREFCRDRGTRAGIDVAGGDSPRAETLDGDAEPFAPNAARPSRLWQPALLERAAYLAMLFCLLVPCVFLLGEWFRIRLDSSAQERQLATLKVDAAPILEKRRAALEGAEFLEGVKAALPPRSPFEVLASVSQVLPDTDVYFGDVDVRATTLKAQILSGGKLPSAAELLAGLEKFEALRNIQLTSDSYTKSLSLTADLSATPAARGARSE